jgi:sec-independent protein translocase protein TatC
VALLDGDEDLAGQTEFARMSLVEHLAELRNRLFKTAIAVTIGAIVCFALYNPLLDFLVRPYCDLRDGDCTLFVLSPLDGIATRLKIAGYGGLIIASPVVLWQLWRFITPGLHKKEKRYAVPFILAAVGLFFLGVFLAYITFPKALEFLIDIGGDNLQEIYSPKEYISFLLKVMLAFGLAFEFPVVLVFLQLVRVLSSARLRSWRRGAIVAIIAAAAIITPSQDPWSLMAMALPMYAFYEISIVIGRTLKR